jgi:putative endonuclease
MDRVPCVYLLASAFHGRLYTGVTSNLLQRIAQHRGALAKGPTSRYSIKRLVWFEIHEGMESAIIREKRIKRWVRPYKYALVELANPTWRDLAEDFGFESLIQKKVDPGSSPG